MLAPFLPFVTEEVWSWWHEGSIHRAAWPDVAELTSTVGTEGTLVDKTTDGARDTAVLDMAAYVLGEIRRAKTGAKRSMRAPVARLVVTDEPERLSLLALGESDLCQAGSVLKLVTREGPTRVEVELAPDDQAGPAA